MTAFAVKRVPFFSVTALTSPVRSTSAIRANALTSHPKARACCAMVWDSSRPEVSATPG